MRTLRLVNEACVDGYVYYEYLSRNNRYFYFKCKENEDDYKIIDEDEYNKALGINKRKPTFNIIKNNKLKNLILPIILTGMVSQSLTGCVENKDNSASYSYEHYEGRDVTAEDKFYFNDYIFSLNTKIDDFFNGQNNIRLINNLDESFPYDVYVFDSFSLDTLPTPGRLQKYATEFFKHPDIEITNDVPDIAIDYEEEKEIVNKLDIDRNLKVLLNTSINRINAIGDKRLSTLLYLNLKRANTTIDNSNYSNYDYFNNELTISNKIFPNNKSIKDLPANEEERFIMDNTYFYTIPYSVSYMATHSYINGYEYSPERIVLTVDKETGKVSNMFKVGSCLSKGISDYLTYDIANVKGNRVIGSPINECFYIAFIKMLNINNYEELSSLNVETFVNKFNEVGLPNPIKYLIALDFQETNPYYDYTQLFIELLKEYMTIQYENGVGMEEIKAVINDILNTIEERVIITDDEREYIADVNTQAVLSYQDIKNYLYEIYNSKVKKVN